MPHQSERQNNAGPRVDYIGNFKKGLADIDKLERTPGIIRDMAVQALGRASNASGIPTITRVELENSRAALENISDGSMRENFKVIYSQMCILAVSHLEATLKKYFENALNNFSNINQYNDDLKKIKISLAELVENKLKFSGKFGKLVLERVNLNFQDLKSIKRIFSDYLSRSISLDDNIQKKICFYLEVRHVLVHKGGIVDGKFVQATNSFGANIKSYTESDRVELNEQDWNDIKESFGELIDVLTRYKGKQF